MKQNISDGPTAQRPHTEDHNSTGHMPGVHDQAYIKELRINCKFNLQTTKT